MAVNYRTTLKNARLQAVIDDIGAGGRLKIGTSGMALLLADIPLATPAFGTPSAGAMALAGVPVTDTLADATAPEGDPAATATITKSDGTVVISGLTVGTSGANINLASTAIQANIEVRIDSGTITHG
jgi:uncharacterized Zn-binding protein involved in type VI secretion